MCWTDGYALREAHPSEIDVHPYIHTDNFNPQAITFYRPIDAVLRCCDLVQYEAEIL